MEQLEIEFTRLVKEYKSTVYTVCMMFADDPDETDDLVQEALIHLWKGFQGVRQVSKTWVWRVTMNSCISIDRKNKRKKATECALTVAHENVMQDASVAQSPNVKKLYERIHALNPFDRSMVMLWLEGMSYEEIGDVMGISPKNVSVKLFRIKEQLKQMTQNGKQ
ncbi:MAG: sigma-70 family RNA polymerase sigma factor [Bacteroidales bacterium]|nr:sigma-70 family RNA polymerase sigma factor [Bacteroidales bacterium]